MQDQQSITIRVAIQRPIYKLLDYACAPDKNPEIGCRVKVTLGNYEITGIVVEIDVKSEFDELKPVLEVLDEKPLLDDSLMTLLDWASSYYFYPMGEVLFHALPKNLRTGKKPPQLTLWSAIEPPETIKGHPPTFELFLDQLKRSPKQTQLFSFLIENGESDSIQLQNTCGDNWRASLNQLIKKEFITSRGVDADFFPDKTDVTKPKKIALTLTEEQQQAVDNIQSYFTEEKLKPTLLHGITGSGKTEVYLRSIETLLANHKQVLVLVPEIGLTPQLLHRFQQHFPQHSIVSLHSGLSDGDRTRAWLGARSGAIQVVIGTRSAVFTPMLNLGAIIIDEEHDASFKQQEGFLYQGRDMAIKRAHDAKIPVLLGSATPSLESLHNADTTQNRYHYLRLNSRPGTSKPPVMVLQDIRTLPLEAGISNLLLAEIQQHLQHNNQVMLFLNRRGFSPVLMCPDCGWHASCKNCDMGMTYHARAGKVICHHCSLETPISSSCPDCKRNRLTTLGQGTERIEAVLNSHFPDTPIVRIDRDSTSKKGSLESKLELVNKGEPVILVGTQMLTKGHDFPKLTLVGILDVDQALFSVDYRAQERLTQQVLQVAGRAGRGADKGKVILQTSQPQHPLLLNLLSKGYTETAKELLNERTLWNYPPVGAQALIRVNAEDEAVTLKFLTNVVSQLRDLQTQQQNGSVELLGPMPSPIAKRANRYRFQVLISAKNRRELHQFLAIGFPILTQARKMGGTRWNLDIDPTDFM
ncbi:MAG: primosomal protein N' [Cocleimonas sp.]